MVKQADIAYVTDVSFIRTCESWFYLAFLIDIYACTLWLVDGSAVATQLGSDMCLVAVWRKFSKSPIAIHLDQGSQFGNNDFLFGVKSINLFQVWVDKSIVVATQLLNSALPVS